MNRTARDRSDAWRPRPVRRIELNEDKLPSRLILVGIFLAIGIAALGFAINKLLSSDPGWREIEVSSGTVHCGGDFTFTYELGRAGISPTAENKKVNILYSEACEEAYALFSAHEDFEGVHNLRYLSRHPGEEVTVDPALYEAFQTLGESRWLYLAPVYEMYATLFACTEDSEAVNFDPAYSADTAEFIRAAAAYAADPASIRLERLGENRVKLVLSEEYAAFAAENGCEDVLDFFWLKNAFTADYLAEKLIEQGCTHGYLASRDGFTRNLYEGVDFSLPVTHREGMTVTTPGVLQYEGPMALCVLRSYPGEPEETTGYYIYADGAVRASYIDPDGESRTACPELIVWGRDTSCGELAVRLAPLYTAETLPETELAALAQEGMETLCWVDGEPSLHGEGAQWQPME